MNLFYRISVNILLIGASGYIAHHCARKLNSAGHSLFGMDFFKPRDTTIFQQFYVGDGGNIELVRNALKEHRIECILYAAGSNDNMGCETHPIQHYVHNVASMIFTASALSKIYLPSIVFLSSTQVYFPKGIITEETHHLPITTYGRIKNSVEGILESFHLAQGLNYIILHISDVLGVHPNATVGPNRFHILHRLLKPDNSLPDILPRLYNFIHVEDVAQAVFQSIVSVRHGTSSRYNIAGEHTISLESFAHYVTECTHRDTQLPKFCSYPDKVPGLRNETLQSISSYTIDTHRAQQELNWHLQYPDLDYMITSTVDWWRRHEQL